MPRIAAFILASFLAINLGSVAFATHCGDGQQHQGPCQWGHPPLPGITCVCQ